MPWHVYWKFIGNLFLRTQWSCSALSQVWCNYFPWLHHSTLASNGLEKRVLNKYQIIDCLEVVIYESLWAFRGFIPKISRCEILWSKLGSGSRCCYFLPSPCCTLPELLDPVAGLKVEILSLWFLGTSTFHLETFEFGVAQEQSWICFRSWGWCIPEVKD